ncbi:MAG: hypothetical protein LBK60_00410 [Verrucomicrobiales bacterium]|nr:hypothetical protein [Verrucomicrobiales bacterium]
MTEKLSAQWGKLYQVAGTTLTVGTTDLPAIVGGSARHGKEDWLDASRNVRRSTPLVRAADWERGGGTVETKLVWRERRWRVVCEETVPEVSPFVQLEVINE